MNRFIYLLLSVVIAVSVAGCGSAPVDSEQANAQRNRAAKAQQELGAEVSKQKTDREGR